VGELSQARRERADGEELADLVWVLSKVRRRAEQHSAAGDEGADLVGS